MNLTDSEDVGTLGENEIRALVDRCPPEHRWAFEPWLRGERHLDGDLIERANS